MRAREREGGGLAARGGSETKHKVSDGEADHFFFPLCALADSYEILLCAFFSELVGAAMAR